MYVMYARMLHIISGVGEGGAGGGSCPPYFQASFTHLLYTCHTIPLHEYSLLPHFLVCSYPSDNVSKQHTYYVLLPVNRSVNYHAKVTQWCTHLQQLNWVHPILSDECEQQLHKLDMVQCKLVLQTWRDLVEWQFHMPGSVSSQFPSSSLYLKTLEAG